MKTKVAKKMKKPKQHTGKQQEEQFSFDKEIVIGVTKKADTKKMQETKKKNKKQSKKKKKQKPIKGKMEKKVLSQQEQETNRKKRKKAVFLIKYGSLATLLLILIVSAMFSPLFNIKTIQVEGNNKITEKEILSLAQVQIDQNIFKLSKYKIKKQIKENAYIDDVTITRKLPSNLIIKVEEREPAYLLEYAGSYLYVDKQGYFLEITQEKLELPILQEALTPTTEFNVRKSLM